MSPVPHLDHEGGFPPSSEALDYPNGLLAVGGDLSPERLTSAYRRGIFPWFEEDQPALWWTPDPRSILLPDELHISRSLRKTLRQDRFQLSVDQHFTQVMGQCGDTRIDREGTWINPLMLEAYARMHELGIGHSVEVFDQSDELVGGLYGLALGGVFFGESMFSLVADASKVAFVALVHMLKKGGFSVIDCQIESEHLNSLGAHNISRLDFESLLAQTVDKECVPGIWQVPATCGGLL